VVVFYFIAVTDLPVSLNSHCYMMIHTAIYGNTGRTGIVSLEDGGSMFLSKRATQLKYYIIQITSL
jgi:hypothetical protein